MQDEAWKMFVRLSEQSMAETEAALETVFASYERRIAQLERENLELRQKLHMLHTTSLVDLAHGRHVNELVDLSGR